MKQLMLLVLIAVSFQPTHAQFLNKGKIEFERKINVHKQFEGEGEWSDVLKKTVPQFKTDYFDFYFDGQKSIYKPGRPGDNTPTNFWNSPAAENVVFNDYSLQQSTSQKQVFEQNYLVQDSLRKIQWKLTPDTRKIAGFECRKATAIIMDSIYVVAFFSEEIMVPGGPESFSGLPGLILGLALPRLNITWFATKVQLAEVKPSDMLPPVKGKKTNVYELKNTLQKSLKDWGKYAHRYIWLIMI